jgi:hypothetical protein
MIKNTAKKSKSRNSRIPLKYLRNKKDKQKTKQNPVSKLVLLEKPTEKLSEEKNEKVIVS